jgi:hypothetical protein
MNWQSRFCKRFNRPLEGRISGAESFQIYCFQERTPPMDMRHHSNGYWRLAAAAFISFGAVQLCSCGGGPSPVRPPSISASAAGEEAIELCDASGDGTASADELEKAPSLKSALKRLDTNGDGAVSPDEVADRIDKWQEIGIGVMSFGFTVTLNGSPLTDALVTFEPEGFLGDEFKAASGTTNRYGGGSATIAKEDRPDATYPPGMQLGFYRVKVSKQVNGKETIPAKYNEATVLGQEVAPDVPEILNNRVVYALTTK